jgi:phosphoribosylpyrophosphate synthetase
MLKDVGLYKSAIVIDPHDKEGLDALGVPVLAFTVLPELIRYFEEYVWENRDYRLVIADDGAIGRTLWTSLRLEIPIATRLVKQRRNGKPEIIRIDGAEKIKGKKALLIEDMIASGGTSRTDARVLEELGALGTTVLATHVKDVDESPGTLSQYLSGREHTSYGLNSVIVSNTTPFSSSLSNIDKVHVVDVIPAITRMFQTMVKPAPDMLSDLREHIFPMRSKRGMIASLHREYQDLAPDYQDAFEQERETHEDELITTLEELGIW